MVIDTNIIWDNLFYESFKTKYTPTTSLNKNSNILESRILVNVSVTFHEHSLVFRTENTNKVFSGPTCFKLKNPKSFPIFHFLSHALDAINYVFVKDRETEERGGSKKGRASSSVPLSLRRATNPIMKRPPSMTSAKPSYLPKASLTNVTTFVQCINESDSKFSIKLKPVLWPLD